MPRIVGEVVDDLRAVLAQQHLDVELILQAQPELRLHLEQQPEAQRGIGSDCPRARADFVDPTLLHPDRLRDPVACEAHRLDEVGEQHRARVYRRELASTGDALEVVTLQFLARDANVCRSIGETPAGSVIVDDLDLVCIAGLPAKTDAPMLIHTDRILTLASTEQRLQLVARRHPKCVEHARRRAEECPGAHSSVRKLRSGQRLAVAAPAPIADVCRPFRPCRNVEAPAAGLGGARQPGRAAQPVHRLRHLAQQRAQALRHGLPVHPARLRKARTARAWHEYYVNKQSPELEVKVDRVNAGSAGVTTGQLGFNLRRSVYGQEISTYKEGDDDYNIVVRMQDDQRKNENILFNQSLTFRNQNNGQMMQVPISAVSKTEKTYTYNQIKRKGYKRIMTIYSNVLTGYNGDEITKQIATELKGYELPKGIIYSFSGVQEEQGKNQSFLLYALFLAMAGITIIIVLQFNSISKTIVILFTVILSFSGVFYGYVIANMDFVILMTMMGIISLAGIVVKNGIVLMDFFVLLLDKKVADKGVESHDDLNLDEIKEVIIESGKSRLRPVLLTALTAVLGLIPLAIGLNFDFFGLITDLNPHLYMGGDNVIFWSPLAWTIIFGLTYATILTLVMVPVMFFLVKRTKYWLRDRKAATV